MQSWQRSWRMKLLIIGCVTITILCNSCSMKAGIFEVWKKRSTQWAELITTGFWYGLWTACRFLIYFSSVYLSCCSFSSLHWPDVLIVQNLSLATSYVTFSSMPMLIVLNDIKLFLVSLIQVLHVVGYTYMTSLIFSSASRLLLLPFTFFPLDAYLSSL